LNVLTKGPPSLRPRETMPQRTKVLYISYDGMLEPLGQSQVLAYLELLARDYRIHLMSFEKERDFRDKGKLEALRRRIDAAGICWTSLTYHKSPSTLATAWDIAAGGTVALSLAVRHRIQIVHVRSYLPALMALAVRRLANAKLLFDIRGFWVDERIDGGLWPRNGWLYRIAKRVEKTLFKSADHIVTLTRASAREIETFPYLSDRVPPISVIPTCADLNRFSIGAPSSDDVFVLGYVGSVGSWYLFDETLRCLKALREVVPNARMLIVNRSEHEQIRNSIARADIAPSLVDIHAADHADVARLIRRMSAGTALIKPAYSKLASAPTKLAEYLGCGVPCLGNTGVGDMQDILQGEGVGVVLSNFSDQSLVDGAKELVRLVRHPETARRCRETAIRLFSLKYGATKYKEIYESLNV
jgi:glycosyltransferase involved in cell wall biosynthesis